MLEAQGAQVRPLDLITRGCRSHPWGCRKLPLAVQFRNKEEAVETGTGISRKAGVQ